MVKMQNILQNGNKISMDCYKEGEKAKHFNLVIDASTYAILSTSSESKSIYAKQAAKKISELASLGSLPTEAISIWC